jgi:hypothetical protein
MASRVLPVPVAIASRIGPTATTFRNHEYSRIGPADKRGMGGSRAGRTVLAPEKTQGSMVLYVRISRSGCAIRNHGWRWHMFEEKREAVMAIEAAVLPLLGCN